MWGGVRETEIAWTERETETHRDRETPGDAERDSFIHLSLHSFSKLSLSADCTARLCAG